MQVMVSFAKQVRQKAQPYFPSFNNRYILHLIHPATLLINPAAC